MLICLTWRNDIEERVMRQGRARDLFGVIPSLSFSLPLQMFVYFHNLYTILLIAFCDNIIAIATCFLAKLVRKRILELVCFPSECCYYIPARLPEGIYKVTTQTNCFLCPNSQTITTFFLYIISIQSIFWNPKLIAICATSSIGLCPDQRRQL